jgi:pimeloyl-ACP methyl ester carboxylesterase
LIPRSGQIRRWLRERAAATHRLVRQGAELKAELDRHRDHGGIRAPLTILHGARDALVPVSASRTLHEANPGSKFVVLGRSGHCPQLDAPTVVAQHVRQLAGPSSADKESS